MPKDTINIEGNVSVEITKQGSYYVAYCSALDLSTCARTMKKAQKMFAEALSILIKETSKNGTLENLLLECGWKKKEKEYQPPMIIETYPLPIKSAQKLFSSALA